MPVRIHIPSLLRQLYSTQPIETVEAATVTEMARALEARFPGIGERLLEPDGRLRRYVHVFINGEDARRQGKADDPLGPEAEVWIVANVAGGNGTGSADG
jgi:molybdopterin converting factor small subunit